MTTTTTTPVTPTLDERFKIVDDDHFSKLLCNILKGLTKEEPNITFGQLTTSLENQNTHLLAAFKNLSLGTFGSLFAPTPEIKDGKKPKAPKAPKAYVTIANFTDEKVRAEYAEELYKFIETSGPTDSGRGPAPRHIRAAIIRGSKSQQHDTIKMLEREGRIASTGDARGLCWCVAAFHATAQAKLEAQKAAAKEKTATKT